MSLAIADLGLVLKKTDGTVAADVNHLDGTEAKKARDVIWNNIESVEIALETRTYSSLGIDDRVFHEWIGLMKALDKKLNDRASKPYYTILGRYKKQLDDDAAAAAMMTQSFVGANVPLAGLPPVLSPPWRTVPPVMKLTEDNFDDWSMDLEIKLQDEGVLDAIRSELSEGDIKNKKALMKIKTSVPDELALDVINTNSAYWAYVKIKEAYGAKTYERQAQIEEEIKRMKLTAFDKETVNKHLVAFSCLMRRLQHAGATVSTGKHLYLLGSTLPAGSPYSEVAIGLRNYQTIQPARDRFRLECQMWHEQGLTVDGNSYAAFMTSSRKGPRKKILCFNCWQWTDSHAMRSCPNPTVGKPSHIQSLDPPDGASSGDSALMLNRRNRHISTERALLTLVKTYLDSGASSHYRRNAGGFRNWRKTPNTKVTTANGQCCSVRGVGDATYGKLVLHNAKVVPDLSSDLISVSQLDKDFVTVFGNGGASVYKKEDLEFAPRGSPVLTATLVNGLYECNKKEATVSHAEESSVNRVLTMEEAKSEGKEQLTKVTNERDQLRGQVQEMEALMTRLMQRSDQVVKDYIRLEKNLRRKEAKVEALKGRVALLVRDKPKPSREDTDDFGAPLDVLEQDWAAEMDDSGRVGDAAIGGRVVKQKIASSLAGRS